MNISRVLKLCLWSVALGAAALSSFQLGRVHAGCGTVNCEPISSDIFDGATFYQVINAAGVKINLDGGMSGNGVCYEWVSTSFRRYTSGSVPGTCTFPDYYIYGTADTGTRISDGNLLTCSTCP